MSDITEEYLASILSEVATVNHLNDWSYSKVKFESIAQNYFGILSPVVLLGRCNEKEVKLNLVLKLAPTNEQYRVSGAVTVMFAKEIFMYSVVLKEYQKLQKHIPNKSQYIMPQCYYVQKEYCKEAIVLQDMCGDGYKPYTQGMFLDLDHTLISLRTLGKLHALSFILKNKNPNLYEEISVTCQPLTGTTNKRFMEIMRDRLDKAMEKFQGTKYISLIQNLRQNCATFFDTAAYSVQNTCICHGDIWKENILYKYKDNKPESACMIDYQTARICSPAYDALYLIISSTNTELRNQYFSQLLDIYYEAFDNMLKEYKLNSQEIYSRPMFDKDLQLVAPVCLITANTALWLLNGLQEVGHVRSKVVLKTTEEKETAVNRYKEIVKAIVDDLYNYCFLTLEMC